MLAIVIAVAVTVICVAASIYSGRLVRMFRGGIFVSVWVGVLVASLFLLVCSIGILLDLIRGEEDFLELAANLGIALSLFYAGWRSERAWNFLGGTDKKGRETSSA